MLGLTSLARGAVGNARRAVQELDVAVRDRLALAPADPGGGAGSLDPEPGRLAALSREESLALLADRRVGRLCFMARAGVPDVVPVNYVLRGDRVLVRSGPGPKLQAAERGEVVAFEVDDIDDGGRSGRSVVVVGRAQRLTAAEAQALEGEPEPWAAGPRRHVLAIELRRVTGRRLG